MLTEGRLASGSEDNTVRPWDAKTGAETGRFEGHSNWVSALAVLPGFGWQGLTPRLRRTMPAA